jgi:hypothetical protein
VNRYSKSYFADSTPARPRAHLDTTTGRWSTRVHHFSQDWIAAEVRIQTVVQRYVDGTGKVCFRTLYTRYWTD